MARRKSPRGNGEGSITQLADGRYQARISLPNGKRKAFYAKTREEASDKLVTALHDFKRGLPIAGERLTVGQFLDRWLEESARPSIRPSTYRSYVLHVERHIKPQIGRVRLARLSPQDVQRMLGANTKAGLAPSSVLRVRAVLRKAINVAERWALVTRNVVKMTDAPRAKRREVQPLTPEEARRLLDAVKEDRWGALYTLAITTGVRQGEALGLGWADVDLNIGTIVVRRSVQRVDGRLQYVDLKSERSRRTATLPPITVARLREHRAAQNRDRLLAGPDWQDTGLVFTTSKGTPLDGGNVTKRLQRILANAELPRQRFHDLRHAYASYLIGQGLGPRQVMEALGHSQIAVTMNTYAHIFPAATREPADAIQRALGG